MKATATQFLAITRADYVAGHQLRLTFHDATTRVVDFGPFLAKARNPDTTDYRDLEKIQGLPP